MSTLFNAPTYSFVVEAYNEDYEVVMHFRIDQFVRSPNRRSEVERVHNLVEQELHRYHERTGLDYAAIATGPKEEMDKFIQSYGIELS